MAEFSGLNHFKNVFLVNVSCLTGRVLLLKIVLLVIPFSPSANAIRYDAKTYQKNVFEQKLKESLVSFQTDHFKIVSESPFPESFKNSIQSVTQNALETVKADFKFEPTGMYEVILLSESNYQQIEGLNFSSVGFYSSKKIRIVLDSTTKMPSQIAEFRRVFTHELTHLAVASLDGGKSPRWLNEGLAEYEERGVKERVKNAGKAFAKKNELQGQSLSPEKFLKTDFKKLDGKDITEFYEHSYVIAKYLVENYGFDKLRDLFKKMKTSMSFSDAFLDVYGASPASVIKKAYEF